ncbi:DUF2239 family protein [Rhodanobacter lindaniclasticus]
MEAVDRFMQAMTGNFVDHEEASRAFYRGERERFATLTAMAGRCEGWVPWTSSPAAWDAQNGLNPTSRAPTAAPAWPARTSHPAGPVDACCPPRVAVRQRQLSPVVRRQHDLDAG